MGRVALGALSTLHRQRPQTVQTEATCLQDCCSTERGEARKMARTCTICTHRDRATIDEAILAGTSFRNIAER